MFDKFTNGILGLLIIIMIGLTALVLIYLGYSIHGCFAAPYIISTDGNAYYIKEYREENGYYYATTIYGNECKIPVGIAVVKENK